MNEILSRHRRVLKNIAENLETFRKPDFSHIALPEECYVLGAGKGAANMVLDLSRAGIRIKSGLIVGTGPAREILEQVQLYAGSHPFPGKDSVEASARLLDFIRDIPVGSDVVFCLTGGASALLCLPPHGVPVQDLAELNRMLLKSGAGIHDINIVRKHVSEVKGGRLGYKLAHTNLITLIESDVPGSRLEAVGSGPTMVDESTFKEAVSVLKKYKLWKQIPDSVYVHLMRGVRREIPDNPRRGEIPFQHKVELVADSYTFAYEIGKFLKGGGFSVFIEKGAYSGNVKKVAKRICRQAVASLKGARLPAAFIFHGESEVKVTGAGKGGRNQELALLAAVALEGLHPISMLSIGTDGVDGYTDAAGALINSQTTAEARKILVPEEYLRNNDSYHFHKKMHTLIKTGPTGFNLMDVQIVLVG